MRVASFNLFFFPAHAPHRVERSAEDLALVTRVLTHLDADVLVLPEVLDLAVLDAVLGEASTALGRRYRLTDEAGRFLASAGNDKILKVALAFDTERFQLVQRHKLPSPASRSVVAELRDRGTGDGLTVIGVHLKSSGDAPDPERDDPGSPKRAREAHAIAAWVEGFDVDGTFVGLPTADAVLIGDFNEPRHRASLTPLTEGAMTSWLWHEPVLEPAAASGAPDDEPWSSYLDRQIIDHVFTSPRLTARVRGEARIYAFDQDPAIADPAWMHAPGPVIVPGISTPPHAVPNLYRVSDHRPIFIDLA